jgi:D-beta-D-heptose 7-phosphate kinase/D-beta-D-heptose 1-phosphate adenosyltransferase
MSDGKVLADVARLAARVRRLREEGKRLVFTNGCFDILHAGHVACLQAAREMGDVLLVGINSDASVRRLKGPQRPINPLQDRLAVLAALSCVDHAIPFEDPTPERLLRIVRPEVYVKGSDYTRATLPEAPLVEEMGGTVRLLPLFPDRSTTRLIEAVRSRPPHGGVEGGAPRAVRAAGQPG